MEEYIKWLEDKIEVCLEDKDLQREHWAFCQALKKCRELALRQSCVSDIPCQHKNTIGINQKYDRCKDCGQYLEDYH
jgi:hypothetical protein